MVDRTASFQRYRDMGYPLVKQCGRHGAVNKWHACPACKPQIFGEVLVAEANALWLCEFPKTDQNSKDTGND